MKIKNEIDIPDGVNASVAADSMTFSGTKGKVVCKLPSAIKIEG